MELRAILVLGRLVGEQMECALEGGNLCYMNEVAPPWRDLIKAMLSNKKRC